jgi:hypothetical protein
MRSVEWSAAPCSKVEGFRSTEPPTIIHGQRGIRQRREAGSRLRGLTATALGRVVEADRSLTVAARKSPL